MKKISSNLLLLLSIVFVLFSATSARADRAAAGDISYKWVSDSTYTLTYTFYRDCGGATAQPTTVNLCYYNGCNTDKGSITMPLKTPVSSNGQPVQSGWCGTPSTTCTGGTMKGFRKWVYQANITLPSKCASWRFVVSIAARNATITNVNAAGTNMHSETTLNNVDGPASSSPTFGQELVQYMCADKKQNFNYSGVDADGDVLSYSLIAPATAADNQTTCAFPALPTSIGFTGAPLPGTSLTTDPFQTTSSSFVLDPVTGNMSFKPVTTSPQLALITMYVTKRRGTKVISTMTRDIEFVISNTCVAYPINFTLNKPSSFQVLWSAGGAANDTAVVCPDVAHRICFNISSPDVTVTISNITDNHLTFSPTSSTSTLPSPYTGTGTNSVSNCFDWTPTAKDEGTKYLIINSEICKPGTPKVFRTDTIIIEVIRTLNIKAKDTFICLGESTNLCAEPALFPAYSWETSTGSTVGIATPTDPCTDVTPSSTTTFIVTSAGIRNICQRKDNPLLTTNQAEFKVVVVNPRIDAGPDTVICAYPNTSLQLNANLINPQPELTYKYEWILKGGVASDWLDDPTLINPKLTLSPPTKLVKASAIPDSFVFSFKITPSPGERCFKTDEITVYVLKGFHILTGDTLAGNTGLGYDWRQKGISDTAICAGQFLLLQGGAAEGFAAVGKPWIDYTWVWTPSTGVSTPTDYVPGTTTITPAATSGLITYTLSATKTGCRDSTKAINIHIEQAPTVDIGDDRTICFGDTVNLQALLSPSPDAIPSPNYTYKWSPGGALSRPDTFFTYFTGYRSEKIVFTASTPAGCTGKDSLNITVQPRVFLTASNDTAICPGDAVTISVAGDKLLESVTWKPNINIDSVHSLNPIVSPVYDTKYVVIGVDSNRCIDSVSVDITVHPRALIYLEDSVTIYPGEVYQIDPKDNCLYHTWFPPTRLDNPEIANPKANPLLNTTYKLRAVTDAGCVAEDSIHILVAPDSYIDIPNAFVPGRGTENSLFKPVHLGNATLTSFKIFDRWGLKVFETTNINEGWDGTFGGKPQPIGVYVYVLEAVTFNKVPVVKQGNVTLIR